MDRPGQLTKPFQQTQRIQKAWDGPVAANHKNLILSRAPADVDKARLLAAASPHSGDWLHAPVGLSLSDEVPLLPSNFITSICSGLVVQVVSGKISSDTMRRAVARSLGDS